MARRNFTCPETGKLCDDARCTREKCVPKLIAEAQGKQAAETEAERISQRRQLFELFDGPGSKDNK